MADHENLSFKVGAFSKSCSACHAHFEAIGTWAKSELPAGQALWDQAPLFKSWSSSWKVNWEAGNGRARADALALSCESDVRMRVLDSSP